MSTQHEPSQTAAPAASSDVKDKTPKRKGPKPSSRKRLEKFRLEKSRDTLSEIHRQATERTSVSLDTLLHCLHEMQIVAQKQEVVVPITTRGVGFLTNESYQEAQLQCPKATRDCTVHQVYRVGLSQLQYQLNTSDVSRSLSDPVAEHIDTQNLRMPIELEQQASSCPQNFSLVSDLVNSVGRFEHAQTNYRPEIVSPDAEPYQQPTAPKRRRVLSETFVPDPYSVTFNNIRATVEALSRRLLLRK